LHGNSLGPQLTRTLIQSLATIQDPILRGKVGAAIGALYGSAEQSGRRMEQFQSPLPRPPVPAPARETPPKSMETPPTEK
jgi:hypothetical protein